MLAIIHAVRIFEYTVKYETFIIIEPKFSFGQIDDYFVDD